jgi:hypothetical protein
MKFCFKDSNLPFSCFHCCCFFSINRVLDKSFCVLTEGGSGGLLVEEKSNGIVDRSKTIKEG